MVWRSAVVAGYVAWALVCSFVLGGGLVVLGFFAVWAAVWLAFEVIILALPMPQLARADKVSSVVLAEDRQILKAFLSADGMWRLPTTAREVPQHGFPFQLTRRKGTKSRIPQTTWIFPMTGAP